MCLHVSAYSRTLIDAYAHVQYSSYFSKASALVLPRSMLQDHHFLESLWRRVPIPHSRSFFTRIPNVFAVPKIVFFPIPRALCPHFSKSRFPDSSQIVYAVNISRIPLSILAKSRIPRVSFETLFSITHTWHCLISVRYFPYIDDDGLCDDSRWDELRRQIYALGQPGICYSRQYSVFNVCAWNAHHPYEHVGKYTVITREK